MTTLLVHSGMCLHTVYLFLHPCFLESAESFDPAQRDLEKKLDLKRKKWGNVGSVSDLAERE